jgi:IS605 OrfB family transposase
MRLTAPIKLLPTPEQALALRETLELANAACDAISEWAWENRTFGQYSLHKGVYAVMRERFGLSAQMIARCISKVADAYKLDKKTKRTFRPLGSIAYDDRILTYFTEKGHVSIWTMNGRLKIPFVCGERQKALLQSRQGESDLLFHKGAFYLFAACSVAEPEPRDVEGVLGCDFGIVNLVTDSDGVAHSGESVRAVRRQMKRLRAGLQKCGSKNAKRHLKKLSKQQQRFVKNENHRISKQLVEKAITSRKALALEDLSGIRDRANGFHRETRGLLGNWAFDELRKFVEYKARRRGVPVLIVDPAHTSQTCFSCGHCERANRKSRSDFQCVKCGLSANADHNAAVNIQARAMVNAPMAANLSPMASV